MSTLVAILRAAHCRSTHHYFAIDALERINTPGGRRLASVLLAHYAEYLDGAKAPDTKFKDFQNHVIHVSDNNWGGAPQACEAWLTRAIEHMHEDQWSQAAYAIGVLSHYFTDPLMPLHTAQHPSEAVVHRPLEWSVCKTYEVILRKCTGKAEFHLESGAGWIGKAVLAAAAVAHPHYLPLIQQYDLNKGVKDPPKGLSTDSRIILAELFDYALSGWARVLERIAHISLIEIPIYSLTLPTVLAAVQMPVKTLVRRIGDVTEQRAVTAIFEEFQATGTVVRNLPTEIREVSRAKPTTAPPLAAHATPVDHNDSTAEELQAEAPESKFIEQEEVAQESHEILHREIPERADVEANVSTEREVVEPEADESADESSADRDEAAGLVETNRGNGGEKRVARRVAAVPDALGKRSQVSLESDIVDAPSIGPKTAARFYAIGIKTIGDFLDADPAEMAAQLGAGWMTEEVLLDWQDQAQLVVEVPVLCGYKSQLLVGVDCRTTEELAAQNVDQLQAAVADFGRSTEGMRILRNTAIPGREEVAKWISSAVAQYR